MLTWSLLSSLTWSKRMVSPVSRRSHLAEPEYPRWIPSLRSLQSLGQEFRSRHQGRRHSILLNSLWQLAYARWPVPGETIDDVIEDMLDLPSPDFRFSRQRSLQKVVLAHKVHAHRLNRLLVFVCQCGRITSTPLAELPTTVRLTCVSAVHYRAA